MRRPLVRVVGLVAFLSIGSLGFAQTTQPGDAIDIEIINPLDGSNAFCVADTDIFEAQVFIRPGTGTLSCTLSCSPTPVAGGSANIATGVIDIAFDPAMLSYVPGSIQNNPTGTAVQGLAQEQNIGSNRIGWALAGTWSIPGNPGSTLLSPCDMQMLTSAGWLFRMQFEATGSGTTTLRLRRATDAEPFELSFADICGTEAFKLSNGGIDEATNAIVMVSDSCSDVLFFDTFESSNLARWSGSAGS